MMTNKTRAGVLVAVTAMMVGTLALGEPAIYEPFASWPDTTLTGNTGGTGLTGNWTAGTAAVETSNLTYGDLPTSGSAVVANGYNSSSPRVGIGGSTLDGLLNDGGELWMSFLYRYGGDINHRFAIGLGDSYISNNGDLFDENASGAVLDEQSIGFAEVWNSGRPAIPMIWDTNDYDGNSLNISPTTVTLPSTSPGLIGTGSTGFIASPDTTYLFVLHAQWGADGASNDTVTLYTPGTDLVLGSPVATYQAIVSQDSFDTLFFTADQTIGVLDEIRAGATYEEVIGVVPPASGTLFLFE